MRTILIALCFAMLSSTAHAQGFATWLGDRIGLGDVGRALDDANREAKRVVPLYGSAEETISDGVRHLTTESVVESVYPVLKNMILWSRNDAWNAGAGPLPFEVVSEFQGFYASNVLQAGWRVGQGNELSLQANSFRFGDRAAIALDDVLVFRNMGEANSIWLWAHELAHIEQYRAWGIDDFTKRYIRDSDSIEAAANRRADEFMAFRQQRLMSQPMPPVQGSFPPVPMPQPLPGQYPQASYSNRCGTPVGFCPMMQSFPVGSSCWCPSQFGPVGGMAQ